MGFERRREIPSLHQWSSLWRRFNGHPKPSSASKRRPLKEQKRVKIWGEKRALDWSEDSGRHRLLRAWSRQDKKWEVRHERRTTFSKHVLFRQNLGLERIGNTGIFLDQVPSIKDIHKLLCNRSFKCYSREYADCQAWSHPLRKVEIHKVRLA